MQPVFEARDSLMFTWTASIAPDAAPRFSVTDSAGSVLTSVTALTSGPLAYYAMFTMPTTLGWYLFEWLAQKTVGSSAYPFVNRGVFRVTETLVTIP